MTKVVVREPREARIKREARGRQLPEFTSLAEIDAWVDEATTLAQLRQKLKIVILMLLRQER